MAGNLNEKAIRQLEFNITLLRSLNDHKENASWAPVIATSTLIGLIFNMMPIDTIKTKIFIAIFGNILMGFLFFYLKKQDAIAQEANKIIRASRSLLVKIYSNELVVTDKHLQANNEVDKKTRLIGHPEWYPSMVYNEIGVIDRLETNMFLQNIKLSIVLLNFIALNTFLFFIS